MNTEHLGDGLTLLRASRLEALLEPLQTLLQQTRPDHPLAPQTVIAAHPGMKQWLTGALARQVGADRIVANLDVVLPSSWLDALSCAALGNAAVALPQYRRAHLRWTVHSMLGRPEHHGVTEPRVLAYLRGAASLDEAALRRFQLSDRLARLFTRYLVYRVDWLSAWEAGKHRFATAALGDDPVGDLEARCLAPLWSQISRRLGAHRGRVAGALIEGLGRMRQNLAPLHVFGLSHLPPGELSVLRAYARHAPVFVYLPDPCREYWGGLYAGSARDGWRDPDHSGWAHYRDAESAALLDPEALDWREQGHPLLARWSRLGQHFVAALVEGDVREDIRHWRDEQVVAPADRLQRLQESIRQLQPALMCEDAADARAAHDASLRIHACHTRQRELEVLRDALLHAIEFAGLCPGDMVVMAPDIEAYLPLIPAVFGEPGSERERLLPYHLADVPVARSHPLFAAFRSLLGMATSRVTSPEVVDLFGVPEVRRALELDENDVGLLVEWLRASRVAWALDSAHKQALSLPARAEHSFAWAMDRLLAGYLMGDTLGNTDPASVSLPDGTELLPLGGIEGPSTAALGSLERLLGALQGWRELARLELSASAWAEALRAKVDALFRIDPTDADARAALSVLHRAMASLGAEPARNGEDPQLRLPVVRELLEDALSAVPERQRFLMGGVTFCGMVPQRAIPFGMVCVLGLDEGAFPRRTTDAGIDLMARLRRIGDRDVLSDDRYLFLETVMSARHRLHLSFIGQGVRDGKHRNPAAPLAELMAELALRAGIAADDGETPRPWLVRHPLQPFDSRYFDGSHPALFTYSGSFAGMFGAGDRPLPRLRDGRVPDPEPLPEPLPLAALQAYYKDPARALLRDHLQVSLDALDKDARLPEDEPLDGIAPIHTLARTVFLHHVLPRQCADPDWTWNGQPPPWVRLSGLLPLGAVGAEAWQSEAEAVLALFHAAAASARFDARGADGGRAVRVEVPLCPADEAQGKPEVAYRLVGLVRNVYPLAGHGQGMQIVCAYPDARQARTRLRKSASLGFRELVPAFLDWAVLRLQRANDPVPTPVVLTVLADGEPDMVRQLNEWDAGYCAADGAARAKMAAGLRHRVRALVELWRMGREGRTHYYPKSAWAAHEALLRSAGTPSTPSQPHHAEGDGDRGAANAGLPAALLATLAAAVRPVWVMEYGGGCGERDRPPGYARLLEGDLQFGDPESDPDGAALQGLLDVAQRIHALIMLGERSASAGATPGQQPGRHAVSAP